MSILWDVSWSTSTFEAFCTFYQTPVYNSNITISYTWVGSVHCTIYCGIELSRTNLNVNLVGCPITNPSLAQNPPLCRYLAYSSLNQFLHHICNFLYRQIIIFFTKKFYKDCSMCIRAYIHNQIHHCCPHHHHIHNHPHYRCHQNLFRHNLCYFRSLPMGYDNNQSPLSTVKVSNFPLIGWWVCVRSCSAWRCNFTLHPACKDFSF